MRVVVELQGVGELRIGRVGDFEDSGGGLLLADQPLVGDCIAKISDGALAFRLPALELPLHDELLLVELEVAAVLGSPAEGAEVEVLSWPVGKALPFLDAASPLSEVVLLPALVLHENLVLPELRKACLSKDLPSVFSSSSKSA